VVLVVITTRAFGVGAAIFAIVVGVPAAIFSYRRGKRDAAREERRWEAWEARRRNRRSTPDRD